MLRFSSLICALACAITLFPVANASASIYALRLGEGSNNGFGYSFLHDADGNGQGANRNGTKVDLGDLGNTIIGDFDVSTMIFTVDRVSTLTHDALTLDNGNVVQADSLTITGGKLIFDGNFSGGYLDYSATITGSASGSSSGSFYFASRSENGASNSNGRNPNSGVLKNNGNIRFAEWGNNWTYTSNPTGVDWSFLVALGKNVATGGLDTDEHDGNRMGLDIAGKGIRRPDLDNSVPEPVSFAVWGALFMLGSATTRRRNP